MRELLEGARRWVEDALPCSRRQQEGAGSRFVCVACPELALQPAQARRRGRAAAMFASASLSSPAAASTSEEQPWYMNMGDTLAIGAKGRKRGVVLTDPEDIKELKQKIAGLTPEERAELEELAHYQIANSVKTPEGKPLMEEAEALAKEEEERAHGLGRGTMRALPRWQQDLLIPAEKLRPGAHKMHLRRWEEAKLELELMGSGNVFSPVPLLGMLLGGRRDFSYAIYANSKAVQRVLGERWADKPQRAVVGNPGFYRDIIVRSPALELTLMLVPSRDLPVTEAVAKLRPLMERSMQQLQPSDGDKAQLDRFLNMFHARHLAGADFLEDDEAGPALKQGSRLMFSVGPEGNTITQVHSPGKLRDQRMYNVSNSFNPKVTYSLFDTFMGDNALDLVAKQAVGMGMSYIANGFSFQLSPNRNQVLVKDPNAPLSQVLEVEDWRNMEEMLLPSTCHFTLAPATTEPLVNRIRDARAAA